MRTLLIADCNEDFRLALSEALQPHFRILSCGTGPQALALLRREQPELFVLDLMLPETDGLTLLETAAAEGLRPKVLIASGMLTDYVYSCTQRLGICYMVRKPCSIPALITRILDLDRESAAKPVDQPSRICGLLLALGFRTSHDGYEYIRTALPMLLEDPGISVTKEVYPAVAKRHRTQISNVERNIRSAIESAFLRGDPQLWQNYFPNALRRPSNAVFLSRLTQALLQEDE